MTRNAPGGGRRDLLMAVAAFWAIGSIVFTVGRWFLPGFTVPELSAILVEQGADPADLRQARLMDLNQVLATPPFQVAALDASGPAEARYTMQIIDGFEIGEDEEGLLDVRLLARGPEATLLVRARGVTRDVPTAALSLTFSLPGQTYIATTGQCTLQLTEAEPEVPRFSGWVECAGLTEVRTGDELSLLAAFDARIDPGQ